MCDTLLGLLFAAERNEGFALKVQHVLFADKLWSRERATGKNIRELATHQRVVLRGVTAAQHHMNCQLCRGKKLFAQDFNLRGLRAFHRICRERLPTATKQAERGFLRIANKAIAIERDAILTTQIT